MHRKLLLIAAFGLAFTLPLAAQPSLYYKYQHKTTKAIVCEPDAPGKDWVRIAGPFQDPDCKMPEKQ